MTQPNDPIYTIGQVVMYKLSSSFHVEPIQSIQNLSNEGWLYTVFDGEQRTLVEEKDIRKVIGEEKEEEKEKCKCKDEGSGRTYCDTCYFPEMMKDKDKEDNGWIIQRLRDIAEIYIGMDGYGGALTAQERYYQCKLKEMYDETQEVIKVITPEKKEEKVDIKAVRAAAMIIGIDRVGEAMSGAAARNFDCVAPKVKVDIIEELNQSNN